MAMGPLPGTWISAMTFTADNQLLVARNNVPFPQTVTPALQVAGRIALPKGTLWYVQTCNGTTQLLRG